MKKVLIAEPYRFNALNSTGDASYMYIRQFQFPYEYTEKDRIVGADSDRLFMWDYEHTRKCLDDYKTGEGSLVSWIHKAEDNEILAFLINIMKADTLVIWTGYRILGTVHRANGFPVWTFELFAKHPESNIEVYSDEAAPNVKRDKFLDEFPGIMIR